MFLFWLEIVCELKIYTLRTELSKQFTHFIDNTGKFSTVSRVDYAALWEEVMFHYPELSRLARVLLMINASEASVERTFSKQKDVHRPVRVNLTHEHVEEEMFIRTNMDLRD